MFRLDYVSCGTRKKLTNLIVHFTLIALSSVKINIHRVISSLRFAESYDAEGIIHDPPVSTFFYIFRNLVQWRSASKYAVLANHPFTKLCFLLCRWEALVRDKYNSTSLQILNISEKAREMSENVFIPPECVTASK